MDYLPEFISRTKREIKEVKTFNVMTKPVVKINITIKGNERHNLNGIIEHYIKELLKEIHILTDIRKKIINIEYHPTNNKKILPSNKSFLRVKNVNSGVSFPYSNEKETNIVIYRKEEFYKVLTHEMLHLYKVIPEERLLEYKIIQMYPRLYKTINLNETFVELNAMLINIKIISKLTGIEEKILLKREYYWSKNQYKKILKFFDIKEDKDIDRKFKEKRTHAFSYYILKWFYFDKLVSFNKEESVNILKNSLRMTINDIENINKIKLT